MDLLNPLRARSQPFHTDRACFHESRVSPDVWDSKLIENAVIIPC